MNWQSEISSLLPWIPALLLSLSVHESAHAWVALRLGDDTAAKQGRISLYPPVHLDPVGSFMLPLLTLYMTQMQWVYGYAKPTPVDPGKFKHPKVYFSIVASAGPLSNFLLALLCSVLGRLALANFGQDAFLNPMLKDCVALNLVLGLLNLLPVPGFDGMKMLYICLPDTWCWKIQRAERWGYLLLLVASFWGALDWLAFGLDAMRNLVTHWTGFPA